MLRRSLAAGIACRGRSGNEVSLVRRQALGVGRSPLGGRFEPRAAQQVSLFTTGLHPCVARFCNSAYEAQPLTVLVDPRLEPWPLGEQRFVPDLDGGLSGGRIAIECQETLTAERIEHALHRFGPDR